ncbi:hypothetical protein NBRC116597_41130 [Phaeobacter sp. NW0010-22]
MLIPKRVSQKNKGAACAPRHRFTLDPCDQTLYITASLDSLMRSGLLVYCIIVIPVFFDFRLRMHGPSTKEQTT